MKHVLVVSRHRRIPAESNNQGEWKMNYPRILVSATVLVFAMNTATQAQVMVDMSKFTCEQLLEGTVDSIGSALWLSGYYNGQRKNTMIDMNVMKHNAEVVVDACKASPKKTVMQTVNKLQAAAKKK
jgi:hypothetical protein